MAGANVIKLFVSNLRIVVLSYFVSNNRLEKLAKDKRYSLLRILINYGGKKFYNFDDRG